MRKALMNLAWGLATAALAIATPLRAVAETATVRTTTSSNSSGIALHTTAFGASGLMAIARTASAPTVFASASASASTSASTPVSPAAGAEVGGGWDELICAGCVGVAAYTLFTGGAIMLPVLLTNPTAVGTLTGACIMACRSVLEELMK